MKPVGILQFPASNCDRDVKKAVKNSRFIPSSHYFNRKDYSAFILPGGFSYGDYLRAGALAARSPAMEEVCRAARNGWPVLGICNGFQILCEARLLEGTLLVNSSLRFVDGWVSLQRENKNPFWESGKNLSLPVAHGEGCYFISEGGLKKLQDQNQIWITYKKNPNGSLKNIAGIMNKAGNVAGLMPHPERAVAHWMGGADGRKFFNRIGGM